MEKLTKNIGGVFTGILLIVFAFLIFTPKNIEEITINKLSLLCFICASLFMIPIINVLFKNKTEEEKRKATIYYMLPMLTLCFIGIIAVLFNSLKL